MTFVYAIALGVALLVAVPFLAHRLRRRRAEERVFAAARLVPAAPPKARRRSKLEDRVLFSVRALAVLLLALLGASPLVRCSRLSLQRAGSEGEGPSVAFALVLDDSMSMRAVVGGTSRFARAREGAKDLLLSTREGDAVAIVLAGAPARVALAATTDVEAARAVIDSLAESDRATDLEGAISMAHGLIAELPQVDRRIVVLSDLADGRHDGPPLGEGSSVPVWFAMPELRGALPDCAVISAERVGAKVRIATVCTDALAGSGREVVLTTAEKREVGRAPLGHTAASELVIGLPAGDDPPSLTASLTGKDAIASDDTAVVVVESGPGALCVVADTANESAATGGAPVVEQGLTALKLDVAVRPLPALPDRSEDLALFAGVIVDDPSGLVPEQRRALEGFFDAGGTLLIALGPKAAQAPLGATLEPILHQPIRWGASPAKGADPTSAKGPLLESAESAEDLGATGRASIAAEDLASADVLLTWKDGAPLIARKPMGRGAAWIVTLPFAVDTSDLTLRPAFLALLDAWVAEARARSAPRRSDVGASWTFRLARSVSIEGPGGPVTVTQDGDTFRAAPSLLGSYTVTVDGRREVRVASALAREVDLTPRAAVDGSSGPSLGDNHAQVNISGAVAVLLLAIIAAEMALRLWTRRRAEA